MTKHSNFIAHIQSLIAKDELDTALQQLHTLLENSPHLDEVIQQSGRFAAIRKQIRLGIVSSAEADLTRNQIRAGLLELLRNVAATLAEDTPHPQAAALREEVEQAISIVNSKNVVVDSTITAGGDVHIGDKQVTQHAEKIYNIDKIDNANFS